MSAMCNLLCDSVSTNFNILKFSSFNDLVFGWREIKESGG